MSERKYSLEEIDAMREAIGFFYPRGGYEGELVLEARLRTHMANATDPQELVDRVNEARLKRGLA